MRHLLCAVLLTAFPAALAAQDTVATPPPTGKLVDIGGRKLHMIVLTEYMHLLNSSIELIKIN